MLKWVQLVDYGSVSLTTATQTQSDKIPRVLGSIVAFQIQATNTATGTPAAPLTQIGCINELKVTDVNRNTIFDIQGTDIPYLTYNNSTFGVFTTGQNVATSAATDIYNLLWPVKVADQPLTISMTLDTLAVVTGGTSTVNTSDVVINVIYDDASDPNSSLRLTRNDNSLSSGTNDISNKFGQNLNTVHVALRQTANADTNFTNVQFESASQVQVENMTVNGFKAFEAIHTVSGHQAGFFPIPVNVPFVTTSTSKLVITAGGSITVRLYQFYTA